MKQLKIIQVSINDVNDIKNNSQQKLQKLHQSTINNEKIESNNNEWVSYNVEFNKQMKNVNAGIIKSDQNKNTADVFDDDNVTERWREIHSFDRVADQEKVPLILKSDNVKKHWILDSV